MTSVPKPKYEKFTSLKKKCDHIYRRIIRRLAGFKCEVTGKSEGEAVLEVHHILKKATLAYRYSLKNGFFITQSLHLLPHSGDEEKEQYFESIVKKHRGINYKEIIEADLIHNKDIRWWLQWLKNKSEELGID